MIKNVTRRPRAPHASGVHRGRRIPVAPTAQQRRDLEDLDHLLSRLIRENRVLRTRLNRIAKAFTSIGEDEVDTMLKNVRKRIHKAARPAPRRVPAG